MCLLQKADHFYTQVTCILKNLTFELHLLRLLKFERNEKINLISVSSLYKGNFINLYCRQTASLFGTTAGMASVVCLNTDIMQMRECSPQKRLFECNVKC